MSIYVLNAATLRPPTGGEIPAQCLLVERSDGLLAIDAGLSETMLLNPRLLSVERFFIQPPRLPEISLTSQAPPIFPLRQYQWFSVVDRSLLRDTQARLRRLAELPDVRIICSHKPVGHLPLPLTLPSRPSRYCGTQETCDQPEYA